MQIIHGESYTYDAELTVVLTLGNYSTRTDFSARTGSPWGGTGFGDSAGSQPHHQH